MLHLSFTLIILLFYLLFMFNTSTFIRKRKSLALSFFLPVFIYFVLFCCFYLTCWDIGFAFPSMSTNVIILIMSKYCKPVISYIVCHVYFHITEYCIQNSKYPHKRLFCLNQTTCTLYTYLNFSYLSFDTSSKEDYSNRYCPCVCPELVSGW